MTITIDQDRLASITHLYSGSHNDGSSEMCVMEAIAFVAHKDWTDQPPCVCPVLGAFMRAWNDGLPDNERTDLLMPFIPRLLNTKGSKQLEQRRAAMAADWLIRTHTVAWLRLAKLNPQAELLAALPEITNFAQCPSLMPTLTAVRSDAAAARKAPWSAARKAAWSAAWNAPWAAAWNAPWAAAWNAPWAAALAAALDAAWNAALDAARNAALDAARDALNGTYKHLQASTVDLVNRMIDLSDTA